LLKNLKKDKSKLNIAICSFDWRNIAENSPDEMIQKLERDGFNPLQNDFLFFGWAHNKLNRKWNNFIFVHKKAPIIPPLCHLFSIFSFARSLSKNNFKPDIVVVYDIGFIPSALVARRIFKSKIVLCLTNMPGEIAKTRRFALLRSFYQRLIELLFLRFVDIVYTINETVGGYAIEKGVPKDRIVIFAPNTIARDRNLIEKSKKGAVREAYGISSDKKIILSMGRLEEEKGFDRLLRAFAELNSPELIMLIAGEGSLRKDLEALAEKLNIKDKCFFVGKASREERWDFYRDADVFILLSYSEGLGLVFWEAMHMGIPIVGSPVGGIVETIGRDGERGFFWDERYGIDDLKQKIKSIIPGDAKIEAMKKCAKEYVAQKIGKTSSINNYFN